MIIRVLLIAAVLGCVVLAQRSTGSSSQLAMRRLALLGFAAAWIAAVLFPNLLTAIAVRVGVGRGTDLLLYVLVVTVVLMGIGVYQRFMRLEARLADVTRELAIVTAQRSQPRTRLEPALSRISLSHVNALGESPSTEHRA